MKIAFLFSGQGVQYAGMGQDLYNNSYESKKIYESAQEQLDWDMKEVCFEDKTGIIHQTRYTQPALFTTSVAVYEAVRAAGIKPDAILGFSLGEYSALVASGVLSFEEGLRIVEKRAQLMDACAKEQDGGMAAVIGLSHEVVNTVCEEITANGNYITLANDNCPGQVVISGSQEGIKDATTKLKDAGARRVMPLRVSGAFHSEMMKEAARKLQEEITTISFGEPTTPIVSNVTASFMNATEAKSNIPLQMLKGVRFRESILYLVEQGFDTFIEIGVKKTLCGFVPKIAEGVTVLNVEDVASLEATLAALGGNVC